MRLFYRKRKSFGVVQEGTNAVGESSVCTLMAAYNGDLNEMETATHVFMVPTILNLIINSTFPFLSPYPPCTLINSQPKIE